MEGTRSPHVWSLSPKIPHHLPDLLHHLDTHMGGRKYLERVELVPRGRETGQGGCEGTPVIIIYHHPVQKDVLQ